MLYLYYRNKSGYWSTGLRSYPMKLVHFQKLHAVLSFIGHLALFVPCNSCCDQPSTVLNTTPNEVPLQ